MILWFLFSFGLAYLIETKRVSSDKQDANKESIKKTDKGYVSKVDLLRVLYIIPVIGILVVAGFYTAGIDSIPIEVSSLLFMLSGVTLAIVVYKCLLTLITIER